MDQSEKLAARLVLDAHYLAVEKGWCVHRSPSDHVNNFHLAISRAWEEYRTGGVPCTRLSVQRYTCPAGQSNPRKPEGFWAEIADLMIRLADSAGNYGWAISPYKSKFPQVEGDESAVPEFVGGLHQQLGLIASAIGQNAEFVETRVSAIFGLCLWFACVCKVDLWEAIDAKMAYNRTRPKRHGGKHA